MALVTHQVLHWHPTCAGVDGFRLLRRVSHAERVCPDDSIINDLMVSEMES